MMGYLKGEILEHSDGKMLVGVGDRNLHGMVGYLISVPAGTSYGAFLVGQGIELFIHTHVREDAFDLYGFSSKFEKTLFLTLLTVSGVGPKSALGILSKVEAQQLLDAIVQGDQALLTSVPGVGKKTAERVVVELRDSVKKKVESGTFAGLGFSSTQRNQKIADRRPGGASASPDDPSNSDSSSEFLSEIFKDAKEALLGLGYREQEVHFLLSRVLKESETRPKRAEDLIRTALKQLI